MATNKPKNKSVAREQADKLVDEINSLLSDIGVVNLNLDVIFENMGYGKGLDGGDIPAENVLKGLVERNKFLKKTLSAIKQFKKSKKELEQLTRPVVRNASFQYLLDARLGMHGRRYKKGDLLSAKEFGDLQAVEAAMIGPTETPQQTVERRRRLAERDERERKEREVRGRSFHYYLDDRLGLHGRRYRIKDLLSAKDVEDIRAKEAAGIGPTATPEQLVEGRRQTIKREAEELQERKDNRYGYLRLQAKRRSELYDKAPWVKTLVKAGVIEQKHLPNISKKIDILSKMPIVGNLASLLIKNPAAVALPIIGAYLEKTVSSDIKTSSMGVGLKALGDIPLDFRMAAGAAGMDEKQIQKSWYGLVSKYGPATKEILSSASKSMRGKSQFERIKIAEGFGLDERLVRIADILGTSSNGVDSASLSERVARAKRIIEKKKEFGFSSEGDIVDFLTSLYLSIPYMTAAASVDAGRSDWVMEGLLQDEERINATLSKVSQAQEVATSAERYEALGESGNNNTITNGDTNVINNITVNGGADIQEAVSGATKGSLDAVDRQRNLDYISSGVLQ